MQHRQGGHCRASPGSLPTRLGATGRRRLSSTRLAAAHRHVGVAFVAMAVPPLTRRGFWWRVVVLTITLLCYLWMIFVLVHRHWLGAAVLVAVLGLFSLGSLAATFWRRPP